MYDSVSGRFVYCESDSHWRPLKQQGSEASKPGVRHRKEESPGEPRKPWTRGASPATCHIPTPYMHCILGNFTLNLTPSRKPSPVVPGQLLGFSLATRTHLCKASFPCHPSGLLLAHNYPAAPCALVTNRTWYLSQEGINLWLGPPYPGATFLFSFSTSSICADHTPHWGAEG